jgi:hypothetical protein
MANHSAHPNCRCRCVWLCAEREMPLVSGPDFNLSMVVADAAAETVDHPLDCICLHCQMLAFGGASLFLEKYVLDQGSRDGELCPGGDA